MKALFLVILSVVSVICARAEYPEPTVNRLVDSIRAELPKGWTVSYDKECAWLEICRDEAVLASLVLSNDPDVEEPEENHFAFAFRVVAAIRPTEYRRLKAKNRQIQKRVDAVYKIIRRRYVFDNFGRFEATTNAEKAIVARYETLRDSLRPLPDFYFGDISLDWGFNALEQPILRVTDDRIRDECTKIEEKVVKLLSKYDAA